MAIAAGEIAGSLTGFTRLSKGLAAFLVAGYVISQVIPEAVDYLALMPGKTIPFAWNLVTAGYFESSLFGLVSSVLGVLFFGKLLEPIWGARGFIKFVAFVSFFTSIGTFVIAIFLYFVTQQGNYLYAPISGFSAVLSGFVVALKQLVPEKQLYGLKLRAKWLPAIVVTASIVLGCILPNAILFVPFVTLGAYISWLYLRFFQPRSEALHVKGDPSDELAFATFFPLFMRPAIEPAARICSKLFCSKWLQRNVEGDQVHEVSKPLPGSDPIDASRRRERGARALEERLTASGTEELTKTEEIV